MVEFLCSDSIMEKRSIDIMISIGKAERLLVYFFDLDEEEQSQVMARAIELQMKHNAKHQLEIEADKTINGKNCNKQQFSETAIEQRALDRYHLISKVENEIFSQPTEVQAASFLFMYRLGKSEKMLERTEIKVTVTQRKETIKELLERLYPGTDYERICQTYEKLFADSLEDAKKQFEELKKSEK